MFLSGLPKLPPALVDLALFIFFDSSENNALASNICKTKIKVSIFFCPQYSKGQRLQMIQIIYFSPKGIIILLIRTCRSLIEKTMNVVKISDQANAIWKALLMRRIDFLISSKQNSVKNETCKMKPSLRCRSHMIEPRSLIAFHSTYIRILQIQKAHLLLKVTQFQQKAQFQRSKSPCRVLFAYVQETRTEREYGIQML